MKAFEDAALEASKKAMAPATEHRIYHFGRYEETLNLPPAIH